MTVSTTSVKITYAGNDATTTFSFNFPAGTSASNIVVYYTDADGVTTELATNTYNLVLNSAISPNPTSIGGVVTYPLTGSPIATGTQLDITREMPLTQEVSLANQGALWQQVLEQAVDNAVLQIQQVAQQISRNLTVPISDPIPDELPTADERAGLFLAFDDEGNPIAAAGPADEVPISSALQPFVAAASLAAARTILGVAPIPPGLECDYAGLIAPDGWYLEYGQSILRSGDAALLAAIAPTFTAVITNGSNSITGISSTAGFYVGMPIESVGLPANTTVGTISSATVILASASAIGNDTSLQAFPFGAVDSTHFNVPDGRGYVYAGRDDMGGTPASRLTTYFGATGAGQGVGKVGGSQSNTLLGANLPETAPYGITDLGHVHSGVFTNNIASDIKYRSLTIADGAIGIITVNNGSAIQMTSPSATTGISISANTDTGDTPHANVQPTTIRNKIIKR